MSNTRKTEVEAAFKPAATIEERRARIKSAREEVSHICQNPRQWRMCIPVQPDDTDIVLSAALTDAKASLDELEQLLAKWEGVPWRAIYNTLTCALLGLDRIGNNIAIATDVGDVDDWRLEHDPKTWMMDTMIIGRGESSKNNALKEDTK